MSWLIFKIGVFLFTFSINGILFNIYYNLICNRLLGMKIPYIDFHIIIVALVFTIIFYQSNLYLIAYIFNNYIY